MKRVFLVLMIMLFVLSLASCEIATIEVPTVIKEIQIVEVPVIIIETEIVEVPIIIYETEYIFEEVYIDTLTKTCFWTYDTNLIIMVVGKGEISYVIEFVYREAELTGYMIQIERQIDGVTDDWFFMDEYSGATDIFQIPALNFYDFAEEIRSLFDESDDHVWYMMETLYDFMWDDYYSVDTGITI